MDYERAARYCYNEINRLEAEIAKLESSKEHNIQLQNEYAGKEKDVELLQKNESALNKQIEAKLQEKEKYQQMLYQVWEAKNGPGAREREHTVQQEQDAHEEQKQDNKKQEEEVTRHNNEEFLRQQWERIQEQSQSR